MSLAGILMKGLCGKIIETVGQQTAIHKATIHEIFTRKIPLGIVTSMRLRIVTILKILETNVARTHV